MPALTRSSKSGKTDQGALYKPITQAPVAAPDAEEFKQQQAAGSVKREIIKTTSKEGNTLRYTDMLFAMGFLTVGILLMVLNRGDLTTSIEDLRWNTAYPAHPNGQVTTSRAFLTPVGPAVVAFVLALWFGIWTYKPDTALDFHIPGLEKNQKAVFALMACTNIFGIVFASMLLATVDVVFLLLVATLEVVATASLYYGFTASGRKSPNHAALAAGVRFIAALLVMSNFLVFNVHFGKNVHWLRHFGGWAFLLANCMTACVFYAWFHNDSAVRSAYRTRGKTYVTAIVYAIKAKAFLVHVALAAQFVFLLGLTLAYTQTSEFS